MDAAGSPVNRPLLKSLLPAVWEWLRAVFRAPEELPVEVEADYWWSTGTKVMPWLIEAEEHRREQTAIVCEMPDDGWRGVAATVVCRILLLAGFRCCRVSCANAPSISTDGHKRFCPRKVLLPRRSLTALNPLVKTTIVIREADLGALHFEAVPINPASPRIQQLKTERTHSVALVLPREAYQSPPETHPLF